MEPDAALPSIPDLAVHIGVFLAIALVPMVAYLMARTPFGMRVRMMGFNSPASRTAGVNSRRMVIGLMLISGGLSGLAGAMQILGVAGRLDLGISQGYGFTAIVVALLGAPECASASGRRGVHGHAAERRPGHERHGGLPYAIVLAIPGVFVVFLLIADRLARE